jgi:hypothetical protein
MSKTANASTAFCMFEQTEPFKQVLAAYSMPQAQIKREKIQYICQTTSFSELLV